jgi:formylglycine-generating enzyme required for sulfatase activity
MCPSRLIQRTPRRCLKRSAQFRLYPPHEYRRALSYALAILALGLWLYSAGAEPAKYLPVFPGAEGYGAFTPGGRGGKALFVTSLQDYDPSKGEAAIAGSFRQALLTRGPRTILFRVSGTIFLKGELTVRDPYLTIAGQSAPGEGVCVARCLFRVETHDVVIRYMRFRLGDEARIESGTFQVGLGQNVILDHCSISWSTDENCTLHHQNARNLTLQWCLISESLNRSYHPKGEHGHGSLLRSADGGFSIHHCIYAHNNSRNPRPGGYPDKPGLLLDFRNNIVYDWGEVSGYSGLEGTRLNYVGNYFKPGPSTAEAVRSYAFSPKTFRTKIYLEDNFMYGYPEKTAKNWLMVRKWGDYEGTVKDTNCVAEPFPAPPITLSSAEQAFEKVLAGVGATLPKRDSADARVVEHVRSGTGRIIDSQKEVGGWPELKQGPVPVDSDSDGMPDEWEKQFGLDPNNPADAAQDPDADGYTNLEEYLNGTDPKVPNRQEPAVDFDAVLSQLAALNAKARAEIAEEIRHRPAGAGFEGAAPIPVRKMEIRPITGTEGTKVLTVVLGKDLELQLNPIPAGKFLMGSPNDEPERAQDETQHWVTITRPFYMGATLVTADEYQAVTGGKSSHGGARGMPAEVDWPDAVRFCEALSRNTGRTFRLPTEAEWEYCCRAGTTTPFNTGATITTDQANFDGKFVYAGGKPGVYRRGPTAVRTFAPNAWGLYDTHGNAYQWCSDWYGPYPVGAVTDPQGASTGADRVIRGGKYGSGPRYLRSAARYQYNPNNSSVVFGFRVVMEDPGAH